VVAALELYFDVDATRRVRNLWDSLEADGIPTMKSLMEARHRPHLSLVAARRLAPDRIAEALDGVQAGRGMRLEFDFAGQFVGRVLWLGVTPTVELLRHHQDVYERLAAAGVEVWDLYRPGKWVPHCTVSLRVPAVMMGAAVRRCLEMLPLTATIVGASVTDHANEIARPL
jgi:hypothetical protein